MVLALWKENYSKPRQHIKKQRHRFADKGPYSLSYGSSRSHVQMWELDQKKAECQRIDAFELWCWRGLLRVHWTAKRSNQSILKEINPEYSLEVLMLRLKLILWLLDAKRCLARKNPDAGIVWRLKNKGEQRMRRLDRITKSIDMNLNKFWETVEDRGAWHSAVHGIAKSWTWLSDWTRTRRNSFNID